MYSLLSRISCSVSPHDNWNLFGSLTYLTARKNHYKPGDHHPTTSKNVPFKGHNHLLTTGTDDPTLCLSPECQQVSSVPVINKRLWPGNRTFLEVASMAVSCWIVALLAMHEHEFVWFLTHLNSVAIRLLVCFLGETFSITPLSPPLMLLLIDRYLRHSHKNNIHPVHYCGQMFLILSLYRIWGSNGLTIYRVKVSEYKVGKAVICCGYGIYLMLTQGTMIHALATRNCLNCLAELPYSMHSRCTELHNIQAERSSNNTYEVSVYYYITWCNASW